MRATHAVVVGWLCLAPVCALATDTWMSVMLDGQKVGKVHIDRDVQADRVVTTQTLDHRVARVKTRLVTHSEARLEETLTGKPLAFSTKSGQGSEATEVSGEPHGDAGFQVASTLAGQTKVSLMK